MLASFISQRVQPPFPQCLDELNAAPAFAFRCVLFGAKFKLYLERFISGLIQTVYTPHKVPIAVLTIWLARRERRRHLFGRELQVQRELRSKNRKRSAPSVAQGSANLSALQRQQSTTEAEDAVACQAGDASAAGLRKQRTSEGVATTATMRAEEKPRAKLIDYESMIASWQMKSEEPEERKRLKGGRATLLMPLSALRRQELDSASQIANIEHMERQMSLLGDLLAESLTTTSDQQQVSQSKDVTSTLKLNRRSRRRLTNSISRERSSVVDAKTGVRASLSSSAASASASSSESVSGAFGLASKSQGPPWLDTSSSAASPEVSTQHSGADRQRSTFDGYPVVPRVVGDTSEDLCNVACEEDSGEARFGTEQQTQKLTVGALSRFNASLPRHTTKDAARKNSYVEVYLEETSGTRTDYMT